MSNSALEPGGFLLDALPSPVSINSTASQANLPQPRPHPLRAGSAKEETARRYVEGRLMHVSRLYTKKFQPAEPGDEVIGYTHIRDVCRDLSEIVDVLWLSGTREPFPDLLGVQVFRGHCADSNNSKSPNPLSTQCRSLLQHILDCIPIRSGTHIRFTKQAGPRVCQSTVRARY